MLYIAAKTQHVCVCVCLCETIQMGIHVIISCDVCITVCRKKHVSKFKHGGDKMLYIAAKTLHVRVCVCVCVCVCLCETIQVGIHVIISCDVCIMVCPQNVFWILAWGWSTAVYSSPNLACVWNYPNGNQCDHIVWCLHHGLSTKPILNSTMGGTNGCI